MLFQKPINELETRRPLHTELPLLLRNQEIVEQEME